MTMEENKQIRVYHTHIEVYPYKLGENEHIEKLLSVWIDAEFRYNPIGFYVYNDVLYVPRGFSAYILEKEFNTRLKELCSSLGVTYIDNRELLKQNNGGKMFESDGVHPKPFYYKLWASNMIEKSGI